jgi:tRNA1(Val) A37 N6-methylase TrmN6
MDQIKSEDETLDTFYRGRIYVLQKKKGYRFSIDAPLLADFIQIKNQDELLELGSGNGIITLLLSVKPFKHIIALEIQEALFQLAVKNVHINHLEDKVTVLHQDMRVYRPRRKFDVVFSNPPYYQRHKGHLSKSIEKSIAKHELKSDIFDIMHTTSQLLDNKGRAYFIFREARRNDFMQALERYGLNIRRARSVVPHPGSPPNLFLTECGFFLGERIEMRPLLLYDEGGDYTLEAQEIFAGRSDVSTSD